MNVVIIDDDQLVALSLQTILEACDDIQVSATGGSGADAIRLYEEYQPDVLLMDIRMENINGLEASENIMVSHPDARILLLTTFSDDEYIIKALSIGAKGYILKQNFESIAPAVKAVYNGQTVFGDEIVGKLPDLIGHNNLPIYKRILLPPISSFVISYRNKLKDSEYPLFKCIFS